MRRVTAKPPKTLMLASRIAAVETAVITVSPCPIWIRPPTTMMPEIALVTDMSGVCSAWCTCRLRSSRSRSRARKHRDVRDERRRGAMATMPKNAAAPSSTSARRVPSDIGSLAGAGSAAGFAAAGAGAAETCTSGGGQASSPSLTTVMLR